MKTFLGGMRGENSNKLGYHNKKPLLFHLYITLTPKLHHGTVWAYLKS